MIKINSVNWCDIHRTQFPCDKQCPQCVDALMQKIKKIRYQPLIHALKQFSLKTWEGYDGACEDCLTVLEESK